MRDRTVMSVLFVVGDYAGGAVIGSLTAAGVNVLVSHETDIVLAMLLGMAVGMIVHIGVGLLAMPLLGAFHAMIPGSIIGMYGGMFFAMRDAMQHTTSFSHAIGVGAIFGIIVSVAVSLYDRALHAGQGLGG